MGEQEFWTRAINLANFERMRWNQGSAEWKAVGVIVTKFQTARDQADTREAGSRGDSGVKTRK